MFWFQLKTLLPLFFLYHMFFAMLVSLMLLVEKIVESLALIPILPINFSLNPTIPMNSIFATRPSILFVLTSTLFYHTSILFHSHSHFVPPTSFLSFMFPLSFKHKHFPSSPTTLVNYSFYASHFLISILSSFSTVSVYFINPSLLLPTPH